MSHRRQCRRPSSPRPTAASQRSHRCNARQLRHASTRARPVMFDTHTMRSPGVRSRSISGEVTSERFHGSSSDRSTTLTAGQPARSRDRGGCTTPAEAAYSTTAVRVGVGETSTSGTPARRHRSASTSRACQVGVPVPPGVPRRARRARPQRPGPYTVPSAAERDPMTTSTPARAAAPTVGHRRHRESGPRQPDREQRHLTLGRGDHQHGARRGAGELDCRQQGRHHVGARRAVEAHRRRRIRASSSRRRRRRPRAGVTERDDRADPTAARLR